MSPRKTKRRLLGNAKRRLFPQASLNFARAFFPPLEVEAGSAAFFDSRRILFFHRDFFARLSFPSTSIGHSLAIMDFILCQNVLPVVIAVAVVAISCYLWRRKFKGPSSTSEQEPTESGREKIQLLTADKVM